MVLTSHFDRKVNMARQHLEFHVAKSFRSILEIGTPKWLKKWK